MRFRTRRFHDRFLEQLAACASSIDATWSYDVRSEVAAPAAPAAGKKIGYYDVNDVGKLKYIDANGLVHVLESVEYPKNQLINGGFNFAQRQVPGTLTTYSNIGGRIYGADRWWMSNENLSIQFQQIDTAGALEPGMLHRYYGRFKKITNAGKIAVGQAMTGENCAPLRGRRVRFNVKMKRTVAGAMTVRMALVQLTAAGAVDVIPINAGLFITAFNGAGVDPTLGANLAYIAPVANSQDGGAIVGSAHQCVLTGVMTRFSACFDVPTTMKNLIIMIWSDGQLAVNDELNVAECLLTDGVEIADWISIPQVQELDRCTRFYAKSFPLATAPAQNAGLAGSMMAAAVAGAVAAIFGFLFPVRMRATPTLVFFNPAAANALTRNILKATDSTVTTAANTSDTGTMVNVTGPAGWVAGDGIGIHYTAEAEI